MSVSIVSCTSLHILCTLANVVTSALAQVFSKTVIHGITFIQLGSGAMVSVEQANEIVAKMRGGLRTEQNLMKDLFNRALRMSQSSGEGKLNFRHAERHIPGMFKR